MSDENLFCQDPIFVVGKPSVLNRDRFLERVTEILDSVCHTNDGPLVRELEAFAAHTFKVEHCVAVANATLGLELLMHALELPPNSKVIVPSFTFVASVHAIVRCNLQPVFCDVDERGLIDCDQIERLIDSETCAILAVNLFGFSCDINRLGSIAEKNKLQLIFDSAHGVGVKHRGRSLGANGTAEVFSLHATKIISGFEGGLITCTSDVLASKLALARNFGFSGYDTVIDIGTNAKLSEIHAAMALSNFEQLDAAISHNQSVFAEYQKQLNMASELLLTPVETESSNYQYVALRCPTGTRDHILSELIKNRVFARRYFYPGVHAMKPYSKTKRYLPVTEKLSAEILCLPTGTSVRVEDVAFISDIVNTAIANYLSNCNQSKI